MHKIFIYNFKIAADAIIANKLRAVLTSLGIICGVASVIAMLAIGKGAEQEILEKMRLLGTNNIIIKPLDNKALKDRAKEEANDEENDGKKELKTNKFSPGLTLSDIYSIKKIIPGISAINPEIVSEMLAYSGGFKRNINLTGIDKDYFFVNNFAVEDGSEFSNVNLDNAEPVCILSHNVKTKLFPTESPIGKNVKCGNQWLKVVGVLKARNLSKENIQNLQLRDFNEDIYTPINTMLLRFVNRSLITKANLQRGNNRQTTEVENYHQLDRIIISFEKSDKLIQSSEVIKRMLLRKHNLVEDFEIIVPELLLEQEQSTKRIFNLVLGAIASISLIVGGIGIMNIMLASVMERMKEIGVRKALGATRNDILIQFLSEAVAISLTGGILGIILGVSSSYIIEELTGIATIVSAVSVFLSFFVSISVGLIFGITPARRASMQHPIELLRYE